MSMQIPSPKHSLRVVAYGLLGSLLVTPTLAADCDAYNDDCVPIGKWSFSLGLGAGARSNPIVDGSSIPLVLVPKLSYYGKRFFLDNLEVGVTLYENDANTFNLIATPGYDRVFFVRNDLQNFFLFDSGGGSGGGGGTTSAVPPNPPPPAPEPVPVPVPVPQSLSEMILERKRGVTYLAGAEWHFNYGGVTGQLDVLYEITGRHNGTEVRTAVARPLFKKPGILTGAFGATWKSSAVVNYYYGERNLYAAGSAFNPFVKLAYTLPFNKKWSFNALAHCERLSNAIYDSPAVDEQYVTTIFAGVAYSF